MLFDRYVCHCSARLLPDCLLDQLLHQPLPVVFSHAHYVAYVAAAAANTLHEHKRKQHQHRDLKLENLMYADNASDARVVLVDFGLGSTFGEDELHNDVVGSWTYMSPDVSLNTQYTHIHIHRSFV
jgi:serine/threonine protein kinase